LACTRTVRRPTAASTAGRPGLDAEIGAQPLSRREEQNTAKRRYRPCRGSRERLGGVRNCMAAFAYEDGEHPDLTAERMRRVRRAVTALYGGGG
jgi:hypothetical protein